MEILTESKEPYEKKKYNALNDKRVYATHTFHINAEPHLVFEYDESLKEWVLMPIKLFAHTELVLDNLHIAVRVHQPEGENPQTTLRTMSNIVFANAVMNTLDAIKKLPEPACLENLKRKRKTTEEKEVRTKPLNKKKKITN